MFDDPTWNDVPPLRKLKQQARQQLGTVGSGNHFVDLLEDEDGWIWVAVHFGSRGFGHKTASGFLNLAAGRAFDDKLPGERMDAPAVVLPLSSGLGQAYFAAMMHEWLRREGVELRGAGTDESPHVYRRLPDVLAAHAGSIRVVHTLRPLGVVMAGEDVFDPYKD